MSRVDTHSEAALKRRVARWLTSLDVLNWPISDRMIKGLPDRMGLLPGGKALAIEFKREKLKSVEPLQHDTLQRYAKRGAVVLFVRPSTESPLFAEYRRYLADGTITEWSPLDEKALE